MSDEARAALAAWRAEYPADPYAADAVLRSCNERALDEARRAELDSRATDFGRLVARDLRELAAHYEHRANLPALARWDGIGRRTERVEFDGAYHAAGEIVWGSGLVADSGTPGRAYEQATLLYLLSLDGEAGHACPAVCTIGLARALRRRADANVRDRFLPALVRTDYREADRASQFLTEVQGGSDVGANACVAEPGGDGTYRISGEKWFCSVADAQQFFVTARVPGAPPGTRGLGSFVLPREIDGAPNGFAIRRLKEKLGTRGMASGEIDLDGACAYPVGPVEEGFRTAVGVVLNTSRWMTAVGCAGMMRRAVLEADTYARHRRAFGQAIVDFPLVRETLARMRVEWLAALHLVWELTALEDAVDSDRADDETATYHRFLVNAAKYATSQAATTVVRDGIEVLGGNGTIEDFSVLPRLYRDAIVYESWEGTHNVLAMQVLADLARLPVVSVVEARADGMLAGTSGPAADVARTTVKDALAGLERCTAEPAGYGAANIRRYLDALVAGLETALLAGSDYEAASELFARVRCDARSRATASGVTLDALSDAVAGAPVS